MTITLEFIAERLERIQTEQTAMCADMIDMKADIRVLGNLYLRLERGQEQIKDILGRIDNRLTKIEVSATPITQ